MDRIQEILVKPELTTARDLPLIKQKIQEYPFVSNYRLLYLIALQKDNSPQFEEELTKQSLYFNQPEYLATYFEKPSTSSYVPPKVEIASPKETIEKNIPEEKVEIELSPEVTEPTESLPEINKKVEKLTEPESDQAQLVANLRKIGMDHLIPVLYPDYVEGADSQIANTPEIIENQDLPESEIKKEAILKDVPTVTESDEAVAEENVTEEKEEALISNDTIESSDLVEERSDLEVVENEENVEEHSTITKDIPFPILEDVDSETVLLDIQTKESLEETQIDEVLDEAKSVWENPNVEMEELESETIVPANVVELNVKPSNTEVNLAEPVLEKSILASGKKTFNDWLGVSSSHSHSGSSNKVNKDAIIENFIETNPKITPVKSSSNDVIDLNALVENDQEISHLMTETLAKLYVEQKKYNKAIEAYEILSLKNPEKSSIFADQIKELKLKVK